MTTVDWVVVLAGVVAIACVGWYFFLAGRDAAPTTPASTGETQRPGAMQAATITVHGGYQPSAIRVKAGAPVRLTFDRQEKASCSEEVVFPDFGMRTYLPAFQRTDVVVTPPSPGTYEFTCGMSMLHGRLVAE